jgi:hypothetical protein
MIFYTSINIDSLFNFTLWLIVDLFIYTCLLLYIGGYFST